MNGGQTMPGLSPALPLVRDKIDGIKLNKTIKKLVKQNLKMLILTSPGERVAIPEYGVGIRRYLFDQSTDERFSALKTRIYSQVKKYMPTLNLRDVKIGIKEQAFRVSIQYTITPLKTIDSLNLSLAA